MQIKNNGLLPDHPLGRVGASSICPASTKRLEERRRGSSVTFLSAEAGRQHSRLCFLCLSDSQRRGGKSYSLLWRAIILPSTANCTICPLSPSVSSNKPVESGNPIQDRLPNQPYHHHLHHNTQAHNTNAQYQHSHPKQPPHPASHRNPIQAANASINHQPCLFPFISHAP